MGLILGRYKQKTHKIASPVAHTKEPQTHFNCWQQLPFLWRDCKAPEWGISVQNTNRGWLKMPQEDSGDKADCPSEMLAEKGFVGKHRIQTGDGFFLHQFQSFLIPFLHFHTASQFNAFLLSSIFFFLYSSFFFLFLGFFFSFSTHFTISFFCFFYPYCLLLF